MAPSVMLDNTSDFASPTTNIEKPVSESRVLLLSPPSLSSHPEALNNVLEAHNRNTTDIQMLDRLSLGLVSLPSSLYDAVIILTDANGTRAESQSLLDRTILGRIVQALKAGGRLRSQDGTFGNIGNDEQKEAILAGLVRDGADGMTKPDNSATQSVPLRFGKKTSGASTQVANANGNSLAPIALSSNKKPKSGTSEPVKPAGVGFVDFRDDFDGPMEEYDDDDDELINEDTLLDEEDLARPIVQPPECRPKSGKRRRACKDCTCGLKEKIESEDASKRSAADSALSTMKLGADELAEVDFTVQGKVGSCGNCSLGDAFRCDGCPYIGLPAFKPGEEVRLLDNDVQL
ncbi:MAG: electron carrier [Pycnora praestabilis]|nr:MAG: electron carrier [Pycnora praestabilis]